MGAVMHAIEIRAKTEYTQTMEKESIQPREEPEKGQEKLAIKEITPDEAIAWQERLGEHSILDSYPPEKVIGAFVDGKLVGVQTYASGRLIGLIVDPEYRRRGIGRELTIKALDDIEAEQVYADVNYASGKLIDSLPENYRKRVIQRDWYH